MLTIAKQFKRSRRGVVLLFAVLMVSLILTISLSLLNITLKQIILSAVGRDSQIAHFVALSARDCALFIDRTHKVTTDPGVGNDDDNNPFGVIKFTPSFTVSGPTNLADFACGEGATPPDDLITASFDEIKHDGPDYYLTSYNLNLNGSTGNFCAKVEVAKVASGNYRGALQGKTLVTAWGYSNCDENSPRRVERAVESL